MLLRLLTVPIATVLFAAATPALAADDLAGLQLLLKVQPKTWRSGDLIDFAVTYKNATAKPIYAPTFEFWSRLEIYGSDGELIRPDGGNDGIRPLRLPMFVLIEPGRTADFLFSAQVDSGGMLHGEPLIGGFIGWRIPAGKLTVRAVLDTRGDSENLKRQARGSGVGDVWRGLVESSAVKIEVDKSALTLRKKPPVTVSISLPDPKQTHFDAKDPIPLSLYKRNVSDEEVTVWHCGFWPNHMLIVKYADGSDAGLTDLGRQCLARFGPDTPRKNVAFPLLPRGIDGPVGPFDLRKYFDIKPGSTLHIRCRYLHGEGESVGYIWSNTVIATVGS